MEIKLYCMLGNRKESLIPQCSIPLIINYIAEGASLSVDGSISFSISKSNTKLCNSLSSEFE